MIKQLWNRFSKWRKDRELNKWYNWERISEDWVIEAESETHLYEVRTETFINVYTGAIKTRKAGLSRKPSRWNRPSDNFRVVLI